MTSRLDVLSLISLVDEDELYSSLNGPNVYFWYGYFGTAGEMETDAIYTRFKTVENPIKYLLFTDERFARYIWANIDLLDVVYKDYKIYKAGKKSKIMYDEDDYFLEYKNNLTKYDVLEHVLGDTIKYACIIWEYISDLSVDELDKNVFSERRGKNEAVVCLLDNKMNHIIPYPSAGPSKQLKGWFPKSESTHPSWETMVLKAISDNDNKPASRIAIKKYISANYPIEDEEIKEKMVETLKILLSEGKIQQDKQKFKLVNN